MKITATIAAIAAVALHLCASFPVYAQAFPDKPLTLLVGFAPGGAADSVARSLALELSKELGQQVVVDNRSGASGNIATQALLRAPADGHTLLFAAIHFATNPAIGGVSYDPLKDLTMVSQVTSVPVVMLANAQGPLKLPADVIAASKKAAGGLRVGSGGIATSSHLAMELFARSQNVPFLHVPYRGGAPANQALIAGDVDLMFDLMSGTLKGMVDGGRLRAITVMQEKRVPALPEVKSAEELGLPATTFIRSWQGIAVRSGTPPATVTKLHRAVLAAAATPAFKAAIDQLGSTVVTSATPDDFQKYYLAELARWGTLIKAANIKAE